MVIGASGNYDTDASDDELSGRGSGFAYIYSAAKGGANWALKQRPGASDAAAMNTLGSAAAINARYTIVAAYIKIEAQGAVYVYGTTDGGERWGQAQKLVAVDGREDEFFGSCVDVQVDVMAVGTMWHRFTFMFALRTTWKRTQKIVTSPCSNITSPLNVPISASTMVIAERRYGPDSGITYNYGTTNGCKSGDFLPLIVASDAISCNTDMRPVWTVIA